MFGALGGLIGGLTNSLGGLAGSIMRPIGSALHSSLPGLASPANLASPKIGGQLTGNIMQGSGVPGSLRPSAVGMPGYQAEAMKFMQSRIKQPSEITLPDNGFDIDKLHQPQVQQQIEQLGNPQLSQFIKKTAPQGSWSPDTVPSRTQVGGLNDSITTAVQNIGSPLSPGFYQRMAQIESGGNPNAVSPTGAKGLFQFTRGTWKSYGSGNPLDPSANTAAAIKLANDNYNYLSNKLGRAPSEYEVYMAHNIGPYGAYRLLNADPNMPVTKALIGSNPSYNPSFLTNKGSTITASQAIRNYSMAFQRGSH